jgi:hypothetical protein
MAFDRGGALPHFEVKTTDGSTLRYRDLWQARNLILIALDPGDTGSLEDALHLQHDAFDARNTTVAVTRERIAGLAPPALIVADRWGEIIHRSDAPARLDVADLLAWADHVQQRCPECEGEVR